MNFIVFCSVFFVCALASARVSYFLECGRNYISCSPVEIPEGHNPYLEAVKTNKLMSAIDYGYANVRPGVHLFYQLYYANGTRNGAFNKPLIIWIQGGPGFAATGVGNFAEIGPLDMDFKPREHSWVRERNLLLIDHPVGAGFSYATKDSLLVKTDREMALDLSRAVKIFLKKNKGFRNTPTYIIGQSYGGKICPRLTTYLYRAIKSKGLKMNLKGIGIGGGWVNPRESILIQPDYLYHTGSIDRDLYLTAKNISTTLANSIDVRNFTRAVFLDNLLFQTLSQHGHINFNNVNTFSPHMALDHLTVKVNKYVKPTLPVNQTLHWTYLSTKAYYSLNKHFMVPSYAFLEQLLNSSKLKIVVYNGNLDVVTPVAGASNWVHKLKWHGTKNFSKAPTNEINGFRNGHYKEWKQFSFWTVYGAGHWVPEENPEAMEHILSYLTSDKSFDTKAERRSDKASIVV